MSQDEFSPENVIVVSFAEDDKAYDAVTALKQLDSQSQVGVVGVAVVERDATGRVEVKNQVEDETLVGTTSGGLVGVIIGVIGGPLGVLLGGATGVLVGSLFDIADSDDTESVLGEVSKTVQVGRTALLAEVVEQSPEVVDTAMARLSGTVVRRPVADVEAELAAAEQAQRAAKKQARKELREARKTKTHDDVKAKVDALKSKLGHHDKRDAAAA
jgi:uncharacterized membrane protein